MGISSAQTKTKWSLFFIANLALLFVIGISAIRESYRGWSVDREIHALEQKVDRLDGRRMQLETLAEKMQTSPYLEREARAKLGLQKPGEHVIVLEGVSATHTSWSVDVTPPPVPVVILKSNPVYWFDYFTNTRS